MALHWDVTAIVNQEDLCWEYRENGEEGPGNYLHPVTNALIWSTIGVEMGTITEANYEEFYQRLRCTDRLHGPMLRREGKPRPITLAEVKAHIGLKCNVSKASKTAFRNKLGRIMLEDASRDLYNAKKELADAEQADAAEAVLKDTSKGD